MIKNFLVALFVVLAPVICQAEDIYIAQSAEGNDNGISCSDSHSALWFNTVDNWGSGESKISPGDTVHFCGTITTATTILGSGSAGLPITLLFESGARFSKTTWGNSYALGTTSDVSYITIDGGTNGLIETTANGTGLPNANNDMGISFAKCDNCEIKNLIIGPIYLHTDAPSDNSGTGSVGISVFGGSNVKIHNNTVHDAKWLITYGYPQGVSNINIYSNTLYNCDHGISVAGLGASSMVSDVSIYNNDIYDFDMWDNMASLNHHDGIHAWADGSAGTNLTIHNMNIYNNFIHGDFGTTATAGIYIEETNANTSAVIENVIIYNNVIANSSEYAPCCGLIYLKATDSGGMPNPKIYNNTLIEGTGGSMNVQMQGQGITGAEFKNNICTGGSLAVSMSNSSALASGGSDYNAFEADAQFINYALYGLSWISLDSWKSTSGGIDSHSFTANPKMNIDYTLQSNSPAIDTGISLLSYFTTDKNGISRPQGSAWDIGAYEYFTGTRLTGSGSHKLTGTGQFKLQ